MPTHWGCLPGWLLGGGRRGAGPGREDAAVPPLPCARGAGWGRGSCTARAVASRGAGSPVASEYAGCAGRGAAGGGLRSEAVAEQPCAPRPPSLIRGRIGADSFPASAASSLQPGAAAPGARVVAKWADGRVYFRVPSL